MNRLLKLQASYKARGLDSDLFVRRELRLARQRDLERWHDECQDSQLMNLICEELDRREREQRQVAA